MTPGLPHPERQDLERQDLPVWAEVDLGAVRRNVAGLKSLVAPGVRLLAVVKADAYGHGAARVAPAALQGGADWLGVARVPEGVALREIGITAPILLLAEQPDPMVATAVAYDLVPTLYTWDMARQVAGAAAAAGKRVPVHVKVDTGMHRYGLQPPEIPSFLESLAALPSLEVQGLWSHFAVAEDVLNPYTTRQLAVFREVLGRLGPAQEGLIRHLANTSGLLTRPEAHFDMVRTGIAIYGIHPDPALVDRAGLEPAIAFKSRVGFTKRLPAGESVSYGQRFVLATEGTIASVPAGYADGVRRGLTNVGEVLIRGRRYPIAGTVTMDHLMVDVGDGKATPGDEVVILGRQGAEEISAADIAAKLGTIPYEVVCGISARVPRLYRE